MDFSLSETQEELVGLARTILGDHSELSRLKASEQSDIGYDTDCWKAFAEANLLGIAMPESCGGLGFGFLDLCLVLREIGKSVVPMPVLSCLVSAALPCVEFGTDSQRAYLGPVISGGFVGTAALAEYGTTPEEPFVRATPDGDGWRIDGVKTSVPFASTAGAILVSARVAGTNDIVMVNVVAGAEGMTMLAQQGQNYERLFEVTFANTPANADGQLGTQATGRAILDWTLARTMVAQSAIIGGTCDAAMRITAQYSIDRKQFERQIGTFQAVSQRMADAYINNQAIELTMLQAASHLDEGRVVPEEVATAKYWACEGGNQIGHAALHIHGGISIDLDYPIHRHFLWIKQAEFTFGAATPTLQRLGALIAG